jgi:hypothetical protein
MACKSSGRSGRKVREGEEDEEEEEEGGGGGGEGVSMVMVVVVVAWTGGMMRSVVESVEEGRSSAYRKCLAVLT